MTTAPKDPGAYGAMARTWLQQNLTGNLRTDRVHETPATLDELKAFEAAMHRAGLAGITWPKAYGGHGLTLREHLEANREIGLAPAPNAVNSIGKELAGPIIQAVGTEEQKLEYLPKILTMENVWCQGFSEPGAGSDLAALRTRADRTSDGWVVNGQKIWTSGASKSQRCLLLARTGVKEDRHKGLVLFAVPMDTPGIDTREIRSIEGHRHFCEVFFNDVVVDEANMLGAPDEGWSAATRVLSIERASNRMYRSWRFESELDHLITACRSDARTYAILQGYARDLAEVRIEIELLKGHVETLVEALLAGEEIGPSGSLPKLYWSEAHQKFARIAAEIVARFPTDAGQPLLDAKARMEAIYLASRAETIYAGTTEIQLDIIAKRILNLKKAA
ncbi:acyl-CoA dehydrogenase [Pseudooceanicola sediminis]|uniref:Acyl-CoA dehydrogenase n=1 Tax=Pseudooceanicola sediminis TaxID=2211117 RepID=A0A399J372_9RHOB|nr:acyl-CoA dehydrogenase family protein [Pseudooceanicola sediminis]KAA2315094.1 acyl-CoA dehydrogenase [Puniceibacterium sp. HSS470]RII38909.1 acyl-CoA dehydrogenase [Pseudooceanicola sediminis]|tara:strand:+ start:42488 stop:43660 length:1173 start_codon:yes stop_codon:yes gene_type:complete